MKHTKAAMDRLGITDLAKVPIEYFLEIDLARQKDAQEEESDRAEKHREKSFLSICPPIYQKTDLARISPRASDIVNFPIGEMGMVINGTTGRGKTRALWLFIRRAFVQNGIAFEWFDSLKFSDRVVGNSRESTLDSFIKKLSHVPLLVLDDLGKAKITPKVSEGLFLLLERRTSQLRPTFITTNFTAETLLNRFEDQETAIPLMRRISEFCVTITL